MLLLTFDVTFYITQQMNMYRKYWHSYCNETLSADLNSPNNHFENSPQECSVVSGLNLERLLVVKIKPVWYTVVTCIFTPRTSLTSHISDPWDHHYQCENHGGRKHSESCHLVLEDRCLVTFQMYQPYEDSPLPAEYRAHGWKTSWSWARFCFTVDSAESPVLLSAEWKGGSDNYWGSTSQQDVTHLGGS